MLEECSLSFIGEVSHYTSFQPMCGEGFAKVCVKDGLGITHC